MCFGLLLIPLVAAHSYTGRRRMATTLIPRHNSDRAMKPQRLKDLLFRLLCRPQQLVLLWNWKAAVLSATLRGPIYFTAALQKGWSVALVTLLLEASFCALGVGLYNALVQMLKDAEPQWLTVTLLAVVFPGSLQSLEYLMHWLRGTPHLRIASIISLGASGISTLFNWYAMRRGVMLVGAEGRGFFADLRQMPMVFLRFILALPQWIAHKAGAEESRTNPVSE